MTSTVLAANDKRDVKLLGQQRLLILCLSNDQMTRPEDTRLIYNSDWGAFQERDLLLIGVNETAIYNFYGKRFQSTEENSLFKSWDIHKSSITEPAIRERANCTEDTEMVLIGKDTGVKARWKNDFSQDDLFSRIDAMPMRRFEMRQKQDKN